MQMGFKQAGITHRLATVSNGQAAIDYLAGTGPYANRDVYPLPCVVLLDLHLPRRSGFEVLQWIREHPQLTSLPVVIVTSSGHEHDLAKAQQLNAGDYIIKSSDITLLGERLRSVKERWL